MQTLIRSDQDRAADPRRPYRPRRRLWTLLHAQALLASPAAEAGSASPAEDDYQRLAAAHAGATRG